MPSDDFNRADTTGPDLGANWTPISVGGFGAAGFQISSNVVVPATSLSSDRMTYYSGIVFGPDHFSECAVTVTGTSGGSGLGPTVRSIADGSCYRVVVNKAVSNNVQLGRFVAGSFTTLDTVTSAWVDGDVLRLEVVGNRLRYFRNGTQLSIDEIDPTPLAGGAPGISYSSTVTSGSVDNWNGGDFPTALMARH